MNWGKISMVILGACIVTALGIDASDTLQGRAGTMLGQLVATEVNICPTGMKEVSAPTTFTCVDIYEASPGSDCDSDVVRNNQDTSSILTNNKCAAQSALDTTPWTYITREQAVLACARSGKRLPTALEWYQFSLDTPDSVAACNIDSGSAWSTGNSSACVSAVGVFDSVGNVWEWVSDDVFDGIYQNRRLPEQGYVTISDQAGIAVETDSLKGDDYFWSDDSGFFGMMRGGFYGSREDAGVQSVHAAIVPDVATAAIGFRCVL